MTRVVQWATGNIGTRALRHVLRAPDLELVGVYVTNPEKDGKDAGTLAGEPPAGVLATTDKAAILDLKPDCVLYMPLLPDLDDVVTLLSSGSNVVTTRGEFQAGGAKLSAEDRQRVLDACAAGGTSIYATGSSPGFISDALPFAVLSLEREVERIEINEYANMSRRDSPQLIMDLMGFGKPLSTFQPARAQYLLGEFAPSLSVMAAAAGRPIDEWTATGEVAAATRDVEIEAGTIETGTIAAQRMIMVGTSGGTEAVRFVTNWYCTTDLDPGWDDLLTAGWRVRVQGDCPVDMTITFPVELEVLNEYTPGLTANRPVNAIHHVIAAEPGILTTADLPPLVPGRTTG
jgi:2,4-diaminopentanoate dehydrogenase